MTGQTLPVPMSEAAKTLLSLKGWALSLTSSEEQISAGRAKRLPLAIQAAHLQLMAASPEILAGEIRRLADFAKAFKVPTDDLKAATQAYQEALGHLPPDLLAEAFRSVRTTHKWGMRLPLPSEILAAVADRMAERRTLLSKLQMAQRCPIEQPNPEATEADRKRVADTLARWRSNRDQAATAQ